MFPCWLYTSSPASPKLLWEHNMSGISHCINPKLILTERELFNIPHALLSLSTTFQIDNYELKWFGDMCLKLVDFESFATGFLWLPCLSSLQSQDQLLNPFFLTMSPHDLCICCIVRCKPLLQFAHSSDYIHSFDIELAIAPWVDCMSPLSPSLLCLGGSWNISVFQ